MKKIPLVNSDKFALIDDEDFAEVSGYRWKYNSLYARAFLYCGFKENVIVIAMHRLVMRCPQSLTVDHINLNKLDNRKENLRVCTLGENLCNMPKRKDGTTSKYKGVSFDKDTNRFVAHISKTIDGIYKLYDLGSFDNEIDAAIAYNKKAKELHGKFARLNVI